MKYSAVTILLLFISLLFNALPAHGADIFILHECRSTSPHESVCDRNVTEYEWWGVYEESGKSVLRRSKLGVKKIDNAEEYVIANDTKQPIFLVRDIPGLTARNIPAIVFKRGFIRPGTKITAIIDKNSSSTYELAVSGEGNNLDNVRHYQILLKERKQKRVVREQVIFKQDIVNGDFPPGVDWIGDLDGDGMPDLLISDAYNCGVAYKLLLSSAKKLSTLVGEAAVIEFGCL
jgi:hypothetical protein